MVWRPRQVSDPDGGRSAAAGVWGGGQIPPDAGGTRRTVGGPTGCRDRDPHGIDPGRQAGLADRIVSRMSSSGLVWRGAHRPVSWGTFAQHLSPRRVQPLTLDL